MAGDEVGGVSDGTDALGADFGVGIGVGVGIVVVGFEVMFDGSAGGGDKEGVVDGNAGDVDGKLFGREVGSLGRDDCVGCDGATGMTPLGVLTVCAGILLALLPGRGLDGTEGTVTFPASLCIFDESSSDGILGDAGAGAVGKESGAGAAVLCGTGMLGTGMLGTGMLGTGMLGAGMLGAGTVGNAGGCVNSSCDGLGATGTV